MPVKHRIRHSAKSVDHQGGLIRGKRPHRKENAHKVLRKWPYYRAILLWFICLLVLLLSLGVIGYGVHLKTTKFIFIGLSGMGLWLFLKVLYLLACKATTCPLCRAYHLVNGKSNKHKNAYKIFPFSYATTAVFTAALSMCIRCMHCGVTFDLNKKHR